jgi:hypothetical protein
MEEGKRFHSGEQLTRRGLFLAGVGIVVLILNGCAGTGFRGGPKLFGGKSADRSLFGSKSPSRSGAKTSWWNRLFAKKETSDSPKTIQDFMKLKRVTP